LLTILPQAAPDTVVVCPEPFRETLQPWVDFRTGQGHTVVLTSNLGTPEEIRRRIVEAGKGGRLKFVVLVGDADPDAKSDPKIRARCVPAYQAKAEVNVQFGSEPTIGTDNYYADFDGDRLPEVAVGRLSADTPEELRGLVTKILAYERSTDFGPWRRQLNFVAGLGEFGPIADAVLESTAKKFLTEGIPAAYRISMTYGNWRSPYFPDPRQFNETVLRRFNEGCWFWVYIGDGAPHRVRPVRVPGAWHHCLSTADAPKLRCQRGRPIALFFACYTGAFDGNAECLGETLLRQPGGPVAVVAGSRVTMPYSMAALADGLLDRCFVRREATLGEALLAAKRNMMKEPGPEDKRRKSLDRIAAMISPTAKQLEAERAEHLWLFNLLGDPLLRLKHPQRIQLASPPTATAGRPLSVAGTSPVDGRGFVELVAPRGRLSFRPPPRDEYPQTDDAVAEFQEIYRRANDDRITSADVTVENGRFSARLEVPDSIVGTYYVRAFIESADGHAASAARLTVIHKDYARPDGGETRD